MTNIGTATIGTLSIKALGTKTATANVYDPVTYTTSTKTVATGDVFISAGTLSVTTMDIQAKLDVSIDLTATGSTDVKFSGSVAGVGTGSKAQSALISTKRPLNLDRMTIAATGSVELQTVSVQSNTSSIVCGRQPRCADHRQYHPLGQTSTL
ncbi:MAG UNVERIFIED_CONTAM: hypothetical protein LVR18_46770 [Planctomycetaceae bacterium]|jgi:hypothetical protein